MDGKDSNTLVDRAKLAEQAERYDDMAKVGVDLFVIVLQFNFF